MLCQSPIQGFTNKLKKIYGPCYSGEIKGLREKPTRVTKKVREGIQGKSFVRSASLGERREHLSNTFFPGKPSPSHLAFSSLDLSSAPSNLTLTGQYGFSKAQTDYFNPCLKIFDGLSLLPK